MLVRFPDAKSCSVIMSLSIFGSAVILANSQVDKYFPFFQQSNKGIVIKSRHFVSFGKGKALMNACAFCFCFGINKFIFIFLFKCLF